MIDFNDRYPDVQAAIDGFDEERQRVLLLRLAARFNNGSEHFDHHDPRGMSWLCLACHDDEIARLSRSRERLEALEEIRQRAVGEWIPLGGDSSPYWWQPVTEEAEDIAPEVAAVLWPEDTSS